MTLRNWILSSKRNFVTYFAVVMGLVLTAVGIVDWGSRGAISLRRVLVLLGLSSIGGVIAGLVMWEIGFKNRRRE